MNTEQFIAKAKDIHGDMYDYTKTLYHYRRPVTITCKTHGDFQMRYDAHVGPNRCGCRRCYDDSLKSNLNEFIEKSRRVHGDKYTYDNFRYAKATIKSFVTCPKHGDFKTTPANHLVNGSCPECRKESQMSNIEDFVKKAKEIHGQKYDYSLSVYMGSGEYLKIICPEHGVFEKTPDNHIHRTRPQGCQKCNEYHGYKDCLPGYLYLFVTKDDKFCKIGISNNPRKRIKTLTKSTPFEFTVLEIKKIQDGGEARGWERIFHSSFTNAHFSGFDGCTEWFVYEKNIRDWFAFVN